MELGDVLAARERIAGRVRVTPVLTSRAISGHAGHEVWLKCEQLQRTGSFKMRGATNFVLQHRAELEGKRLVAASAGNHAQGVAVAGREADLGVTVVMPVTAPLPKVQATRGYGAEVVLHGASLTEARTHAEELAAEHGWVYVPPFDSDAIIAGQGTLGLELVEQLPQMVEVLVPTGGGGLLAGVALAVKSLRPDVRVIGVQSAAMDGVRQSLEKGTVVTSASARTLADGAAVAGPSERTFDLIQRYVDEVVTVSEDAIARAILALLERAKVVVEGAGALAVAALESGAYRPSGTTVAVLSGGNIDINLIGAIVRRGLVEAGRYHHLAIEVADVPGQLGLVAEAIGGAGGNIIEVEHDREMVGLPVGSALVRLVVEVNGPDQLELLVQALKDAGVIALSPITARYATAEAMERRGK